MTVLDQQTETRQGFPSPFEVSTPPGCEGWEEMYPYYALFADERRADDEARFWFQNGLHSPEPIHPFDCIWMDYGIPALNQANARLFVVPPSLGVEYRVLNGYFYLSGNSVTDGETLGRRAELFAQRRRALLRALGRAVRAVGREGRGDDPGARGARGARAG